MVDTHWYFIINPVSGNGKGLQVWSDVHKKLKAENVNFSFGISEHHKHAIQLVSNKLNEGVRHFIGIGGDGTLNEMVNGIKSSENSHEDLSTVGLLAVGTGNDWVKSQKEKLTSENIISKLISKQTVFHDVGVVHLKEAKVTQHFMNIAGAGIDGAVVQQLNEYEGNGKPGKLVYLKSLIKTLFKYRSPDTEVHVENYPIFSGKTYLLGASLGKYFGDGMHLSPEAKFDSGSLYFTLVKNDNLFVVFSQLHKLFNGKIALASFVEKAKGQKASAKTDRLVSVQADGELVGETKHLFFDLISKGIKVLV